MHCIKPSRAIIPHGDGAGCCPQPSPAPAPGHPRCQQCQLDNCATQTVSDPPVCNEYVSTAFNVPTFLCVCFINIYIYIFVTNYKYIFNAKHQIFLHEIGTSLPSHRQPFSLSMSTMVSSELAISLAKSPNRSVCRGRVFAEAGAGLALSTAVKRIMTSLISPLARARLY